MGMRACDSGGAGGGNVRWAHLELGGGSGGNRSLVLRPGLGGVGGGVVGEDRLRWAHLRLNSSSVVATPIQLLGTVVCRGLTAPLLLGPDDDVNVVSNTSVSGGNLP